MAQGFTDIEEPVVTRPSRAWRTVQKLIGKEQSQEDELRYFLLELGLECYAEEMAVCGPSARTFYDVTGSCGRNMIAASLLHSWTRCVSLELTNDERTAAIELVDANRRRSERRWTRRAMHNNCLRPSQPIFQVLEPHQLWECDWKDADFAVFDASRFSHFIDQGAMIAEFLRQGIANAIAGSYVLLMTSDQNDPYDHHYGLLDPEAPESTRCSLIDSYVMTSANFLLRADLLKVLGHSADRRVTVHPIAAPSSPSSSTTSRGEEDDKGASTNANRGSRFSSSSASEVRQTDKKYLVHRVS